MAATRRDRCGALSDSFTLLRVLGQMVVADLSRVFILQHRAFWPGL